MPDVGESQPPHQGQIVTFYSFKGGTGRTMALANVAWILAANGRRVLMADWDLESPGLHRFFQPFMAPRVTEPQGIIDMIRGYVNAAAESEIDRDVLFARESEEATSPAINGIVAEHVGQVNDFAIPLSWPFPDEGALHFLSPGVLTNPNFGTTVSSLDWEDFYDNLAGPEFLDALRAHMKRSYDYVLIDSRTGLGDISDICTVHLPDTVVDCFTLTNQAIEGAAMIAGKIRAEHLETKRKITILPLPMRIDHTQADKVEAGLLLAASKFEDVLGEMTKERRVQYLTDMQVPYHSPYAYEEMLAPFQDVPGSQAGLLPHYERITDQITGGAVSKLPPRDESLRLRTRIKFSRTQPSSSTKVILDFRPQDQLWAEWIAAVLASAEIAVQLIGEMPVGPEGSSVETENVAVVSDAYITQRYDSPPATPPKLLIAVTDTRLPGELAEVPVIFLSGLSENQAVEKLVDRFKGRRTVDPELGTGALRYPGGNHPEVVNIPARNRYFTGRDQDLKDIREELRTGSSAAVPLTIQGLGGVGKTQVALEYAHRYKTDYDAIWWMGCGQSQYVDASLTDLGQRLRDEFAADLPTEGGVTEVAQQVLQLLSQGVTVERWLLVYDNAEDIDYLTELLPSASGHVLITSREEGWKDKGKYIELGKFNREESIRYLRRRTPSITNAEADEVAGVLGDMPVAVAASGALLDAAKMNVPDYLWQLQQKPVRTFPEDDPLSQLPAAVAQAIELSLDHLQQRSAAAARLLELCSVMATDISLELIYTKATADRLRGLDSTISERAMVIRLGRQIDQLALIKLDNAARQIQVHGVVRSVVSERMSEKDLAAARRDVHQLLVAARPEEDVDDPQTWPRYRMIWPHLTPSEAMWSTEEPVRQLLIDRVRYLRQRDDLERGVRRAEEIERAWQLMLAGTPDPDVPASLRTVTGEPDPQMAKSLQEQLFRLQFNLANIMRDLAQFRESLAIDEAVLAGQREMLGDDHPHTLQTSGSLAADRRALGDYRVALELDRETYQAWLNSGSGDDDRGTLSAAHNLALSYLLTGDFRRALNQDRLTSERRAFLLGPTHPRTLNSGSSLARDLLEAGDYAEAATRMENVWAQCRSTLGDNDRITLNARLLLGVAHRCAGRLDLAVEHIDAAKNALTLGFGSESSDALASRLSQALIWLALGRHLPARMAAEEVLDVYARRVGSTHPHSLICSLDISTALCLEHDYPTAETKVRLAVEGLEDGLGAAHPYTLAAKMVLASVRAWRGHLTEARELEETVVAERGRVLGSQHPDTLRCRVNLLLTQEELLADGASSEREAVIRELAAVIGDEHPDVITARSGSRLLCVVDPQPF